MILSTKVKKMGSCEVTDVTDLTDNVFFLRGQFDFSEFQFLI